VETFATEWLKAKDTDQHQEGKKKLAPRYM